MAKKRTTKKRPTTKQTEPVNECSFNIEIPVEEPTVSFKIGDESIEGTVVLFHRLAIEAQSKAVMSRDEIDDYMPEYAEILNQKFKTKIVITPEIAYRILDPVFNLFHQLKKN